MKVERKADTPDLFSAQLELFDPDDDGLDFGEWLATLPRFPSIRDRPRPSRRDQRLQAKTERWAKRIRRYEREEGRR